MRDFVKIFRFLVEASRDIRFYKTLLVFTILTGVANGAASAGIIAVVNTAINAEAERRGELIWAFAGLALLIPFLRFGSSAFLAHLLQRVRFQIEMKLCRRVLSASVRRTEEIGAHRVLAVMVNDVATIVGIQGQFPQMLRQASLVAGCLVYMAWLSWQLFLAVVVLLGLGVATLLVTMRLARPSLGRGRELANDTFRHLRSLTEGFKELKIHRKRRHDFFTRQLEPTVLDRVRQHTTASIFFAAGGGIGQIWTYLILGSLSFGFFSWQISSDVASGYLLAFLYLLNPLNTLLNELSGFTNVGVAISQIRRLGLSLSKATELPDVKSADGVEAAEAREWHRLELAGVTHSYVTEADGRTFTLGPVNLSVERGECIFIVGGNGSGKTTLAKLLVGLYIPESGEIRVDGEAIDDAKREDYRQLFSVVFNDFHLFDVLLGLDRPKLVEQAEGYLRTLQLDRKLDIRGTTLSTIDLSQGQRKRLALLTAYLEDRSIYLFDEWAADQDPHFKEIFYHELLPDLKARGKTILVISHDDHYYHVPDRIVKLDAGQVELDKKTSEITGDPAELTLGRGRRNPRRISEGVGWAGGDAAR